MKVIILFFIFFIHTTYASEMRVSIEPKQPVMGESFNVTFKVITKRGTDPVINFNPGFGIEVVGRNEAGTTTSTTYINGHLSIERSITIVYEMIAATSGTKYLRDISVDIDGENIKYKNLKIRVLRVAKRAKDIMAIAEVDKTSAFVGESILVRYYLYNKVVVNMTDIKKFPKLDKFLKRYHQEKTTAERVRYNGEVYTRRILYTAQLFAEKAGTYKVDPITLGVKYYKGRTNSYSNLGLNFGYRQQRNSTVTSKPVIIEVKQLPLDGMPKSFSGLVGKHDFSLQINKNKFLVNDPIEFKLTIKGDGALELFEMPTLLTADSVEEFDTNSDLSINSNFSAMKIFNATYLGREATKLSEFVIPISYFDPELMKYITVNLSMKPIIIAGSNQFARSKGNNHEDAKGKANTKDDKAYSPVPKQQDLRPVYSFVNSYLYSAKYINMILALIIFIFLSLYSFRYYKKSLLEVPSYIKIIKKEGVNFGGLHSLITRLGSGSDMSSILKNSDLKNETKIYFENLIIKCENDYNENCVAKKYKIKKKYLNELINCVENHDELIS